VVRLLDRVASTTPAGRVNRRAGKQRRHHRERVRPALTLVTLALCLALTRCSASDAEPATIDCLPWANDAAGRDAPSVRETLSRVDGVLTRLDTVRHSLEVDGVQLETGSETVVLIDCQRAPLRDVREGSPVKVIFAVRDGRNAVRVMEAQGDQQ
jgi:hypothetical protein